MDEMAVQLDTVDGLRVYKYPAGSVQEVPAAIIRDDQASNQSSVGEYRATIPVAVYHLEVLILVDLADDQEAYEELEKYISGDSASSVKTLMDAVVVAGYQSVQCIRAGPRRRHNIGGASYWGCSFSVQAVVT